MLPAKEVKEQARKDEQTRWNAALQAQIEILRDRINSATISDELKTAWTIAIIEIEEIRKATNK